MISFNRQPMLKRTLEHLFNHTNTPFDLVIVDNASAKPTKEFLELFQNKVWKDGSTSQVVFNSENKGTTDTYADIVKYIKQGQYYLKLDNDVIVPRDKEWLNNLIELLQTEHSLEVIAYPTRQKKDVIAKFKTKPRKSKFGEIVPIGVNVSPCSLYSYRFIRYLRFKRINESNFTQQTKENEEVQIARHSKKTGYEMAYLYVKPDLHTVDDSCPVFLDSSYTDLFQEELLPYKQERELYWKWRNQIRDTGVFVPFPIDSTNWSYDTSKLNIRRK